MKVKNIVIMILVMIFMFCIPTSAFSPQLRSFIKEGKMVRLHLAERVERQHLTPEEEIKGYNLQQPDDEFNLVPEKDYLVKITENNTQVWRAQVFASFDSDKAQKVKEKVQKAGYEEIEIVEKDNWNKVQVGKLNSREEAQKLSDRLQEDGWSSWLVHSQIGSREKQLAIYDSRGELVFSGRDFFLKGKMRINGNLYQGDFEFLYSPQGMTIYHNTGFNNLLKGILVTVNQNRVRMKNQEYMAAMQAQAVAERTQLLYRIMNNDQGYLIPDLYQGLDGVNEVIVRAINTTRGQLLYYDNQLIKAFTHQNSGGFTASGEKYLTGDTPYLEARRDSYSLEDPLHLEDWDYYWNEDQLLERFASYFDREINGIRDIRVRDKTESGRIYQLEFVTDFGSYFLEGLEISRFFDLESTRFKIIKDFAGGYLTSLKLEGAGEGHGLGLSRDGAQVMAGKDHSYWQILDFYYPGVKLRDMVQEKFCELKVEARVRSGLLYKEYRLLDWNGPRVITVLDLDLSRPSLIVDTFLAEKKITGLADLADVVKKREALAGVNGGFFDYSGRPLGLLISDGKIAAEAIKNRTALALTEQGKVLIDRVTWQGKLTGLDDDKSLIIDGANRVPRNDEVVIFNSFYGKETPSLNTGAAQMVVKGNEITSISDNSSDQEKTIPEDGYIIQAAGGKEDLKGYKEGDKIYYSHHFNQPSWNDSKIKMAIGGGPLILENGQIKITGQAEEFQADILYGRAPRSAVGITENNRLIFVTVDGRQPELSIGFTLRELASFMQDYGIKKAVNLDGGASARLVVRGYTMSNPSGRRFISNGILIMNKGF